ncbi:hypothetical protein BST86_11645 [Nonlabens agnitus]|uniref:Uncharacterized protein n=1 Tax=Nonlabens agnitus TaxID=870484 RepID=A0A2S9WW45_9FLAO|nr:hypothetical protein BST86_11645 [Nonlabens agnitus]
MSPNIKAFLIYFVCFIVLYLVSKFLLGFIVEEQNLWSHYLPIIIAAILSPRPRVKKTANGKEYGYKSIFSKKRYILK